MTYQYKCFEVLHRSNEFASVKIENKFIVGCVDFICECFDKLMKSTRKFKVYIVGDSKKTEAKECSYWSKYPSKTNSDIKSASFYF